MTGLRLDGVDGQTSLYERAFERLAAITASQPGISANRAVETLRAEGIGIRRTIALDLFRGLSGREKAAAPERFVPIRYRPAEPPEAAPPEAPRRMAPGRRPQPRRKIGEPQITARRSPALRRQEMISRMRYLETRASELRAVLRSRETRARIGRDAQRKFQNRMYRANADWRADRNDDARYFARVQSVSDDLDRATRSGQ